MGRTGRLEDIQAIGATAVMLSPIMACGPGRGPGSRSPLSLFAPDPALAVAGDAMAAARELNVLVDALHAADIEVYLQV